MKKLIFPIIVVLCAIIVSALFLMYTSEKNPLISNNNKNPDSENSNEDSIDFKEAQDEINNQGSNPSSNQGSSGGGGSGGSSPSNSGVAAPYCPQISYALRSFIKNSECLSSSNEICTNKEVHCSITVENLGQNTGQFTIGLTIIDLTASTTFQQFQISKEVSPNQQVIFDKSLSFQSLLEDGDANKEYDCSFKTLEIPKKAGC